MTNPQQPATTPEERQAPGQPTWRKLLIAANVVTILGVVVVHVWHAASPNGVSIALLGISRSLAEIPATGWIIAEVINAIAAKRTAAIRADICALAAAVEQLRRELAADMADPLGHLADAVEDTGARVDAVAERVATAQAHAHYSGYAQAVRDLDGSGGDVLPMPARGLSPGAKHANGRPGSA